MANQDKINELIEKRAQFYKHLYPDCKVIVGDISKDDTKEKISELITDDIQLLIPDTRTEFNNQIQKGISFKTVYICRDLLPKQIIFTKLNKPNLLK